MDVACVLGPFVGCYESRGCLDNLSRDEDDDQAELGTAISFT